MPVLENKVALVTGAGRGIGRSIAVGLAQAGARVVVNDLREADCREVVQEIEQGGGEALAVACDVTNREAVDAMVDQAVAQWQRLDIAVTNAAFSDRQPFVDADLAGFTKTIDVTMWGAFYVLRAAARRLVTQKQGGSIVIIGSAHSHVPVPNAMAYNMAKAAIDQMARTAAIELIDDRIRVNLVHPGWTDTPGERKFTSDDKIRAISARLPWGRLAHPDEIARAVVFLCDPASDYITGSTLKVDGGMGLPWWARGGTATPD